MSMCKKADAFFYSKNKNVGGKKPKNFNHFMLKEILDVVGDLKKNLSFYITNLGLSYKFSKLIQKCSRAQIFASNELYDVAVFCKNAIKSKFSTEVLIVKNEEKISEEFYNNKDDLSIFFVSSKNFDIPKNLKTKKVVLNSCEKFLDKDFDIFIPVVFDNEEIAIKTKSIVLFCFAVLFLLSNGEIKNLELAIDMIDDFDIMPIVDFSKQMAKRENVVLIDNENIFCADCVLSLLKKITSLKVEKRFCIGNNIENIRKSSFLFLKKEENSFEDLFCLDNLNINYFILSKDRNMDFKNCLEISIGKTLGDLSEIVFMFYMQMISFYIALFQDINPDTKN